MRSVAKLFVNRKWRFRMKSRYSHKNRLYQLLLKIDKINISINNYRIKTKLENIRYRSRKGFCFKYDITRYYKLANRYNKYYKDKEYKFYNIKIRTKYNRYDTPIYLSKSYSYQMKILTAKERKQIYNYYNKH